MLNRYAYMWTLLLIAFVLAFYSESVIWSTLRAGHAGTSNVTLYSDGTSTKAGG